MPLPNYTRLTPGVTQRKAEQVNVLYDDAEKIARAALLADYAVSNVLDDDLALTDDDAPTQVLEPDGADRAVTFPTPGADNHAYFVVNPSASSYNLTMPAGFDPLAPGDSALYVSDGSAWHVVSGSGGGSNEWTAVADVWTRTGNHSFTAPGDVTDVYAPGVKVRYKDGGGYEYGVISTSSYSSPDTTITLIANSDFAMAAATITDTAISPDLMPDGFPHKFNFVPVWNNFTVGDATVTAWWRTVGRNWHHYINLDVGSSTVFAGTGALSYNCPIVCSYPRQNAFGIARLRDESPAAAYQGAGVWATDNRCYILALDVATYLRQTNVNSGVPFTWVTGDNIQVSGWLAF